MGGVGRVQHAGAGVGHMGGNLRQLQVLHERLGRRASAGHAEAHHAAGTLRQVLRRQSRLAIAFQRRMARPGHLRMGRQVLSHGQAVGGVPGHAQVQALQPQVDEEGVLRRLDGAQIAHELGRRLGNVGAFQPEALGVHHAVVAFVGRGEPRELVGVGVPIEAARVHDGAADGSAVAVHILGGGVGHDIGTPLDGAAQHRRGEGVVHDERHPVVVGRHREALDVEHRQGRIRDGLAEDALGVGAEGGRQLLIGAVRIHEGALQPHAGHGVGEQVVGATVDGRGGHHMIARAGNVEHGEEVRRLARGGEHGRRAPFQRSDLGRHRVVGGVGQTRIEVTGLLQIEQTAHVLGGVVLPGGVLVNRHLARLAVAGPPAALHAGGSDALAHRGSFCSCGPPALPEAGGPFVRKVIPL